MDMVDGLLNVTNDSKARYFVIVESFVNKQFSLVIIDSVTQIYLLFFECTSPPFANFNTFLQSEESLSHCLHDEMHKFRNNLATRFIRSEVFQKVKKNKLLFSKLETSLQNQKRRELNSFMTEVPIIYKQSSYAGCS